MLYPARNHIVTVTKMVLLLNEIIQALAQFM